MLPVAILAGGLATRLRPITASIPKALVDVCDRPFIAWQLDYLRNQGIGRVVLCVGYLGEQIRDYVGDGSAFGLTVDYSFDGERLLGTGGALRKALDQLGEQFFVFYGDSYLPVDFTAVEKSYFALDKPALMTVLKNGNRWDASNVLMRDGVLVEYNKRAPRPDMSYIDYGLGVLAANVLRAYPADEPLDLADVYGELSMRRALAGHEVFERFYEIGSHRGLQETTEYLGKGH